MERGQGPDRFQGPAGGRSIPSDVEEAFGNVPVVVAEDVRHSRDEPRLILLGRTNADRHLFVAFTVRETRIRVISVRSMSLRERRRYGDARSAEA